VFANNISNMGTAVHMELGEINLHMSDEYQECLKESLFGVESNSGSLVNIAKVSLDWGKKDMESSEEDGPMCKLVLSVDVTGMGNNCYVLSNSIEKTIWFWKKSSKSGSAFIQIIRERDATLEI